MAKAQTKTKLSPVYAVVGKDSFLVNKDCDKLVNSLIPPESQEMGLVVLDPDKTQASEVLDELRTPAFLADRKVVLIRQADNFISSNSELLIKYLDSPASKGILVLTASALRSNTRIAKKIKSAGDLRQVSKPSFKEIVSYPSEYAKANCGKKLSAATGRLIIEFAGEEPQMIANEVEKLAVYTGDRDTITDQDVEALCGANRTFGVFNVIDAMSSGQAGQAVSRLRNLFASDKDAEYTAVGAFAFHFRRMFKAKAMLGKGESEAGAGQALGIRYKRQEFFRGLRNWPLVNIAEVIQALRRIDYQSKTGQARVKVEIEQLVVKAASRNRKR
ncbi:DNA polymerase III subunit delta [Sedimentisphaera cyanobacteriorum]|uniref:DNA polymerase III subunit delta n=1 Tax=Sedimentisphaera cyanobacteriorum TaxID=1940790 RepID=A0A1Q2HNN1_9BACT|nr:DNA polymerase III subunit delta [Sedimentisphaera cyanobacteriorum]AQQ09057.1 DNA polymerase III subunit delta [Sedimentisphaera cyanobacteriorum]